MATEPGFQSGPAFSPKDNTIAYVAEVDGFTQVFVRGLADVGAPTKPLFTRGFDCHDLFWSSDGKWIYFVSQLKRGMGLWKVPAIGGTPEGVIENVTTAAMSFDRRTIAFLRNEDPTQAGENNGQLTLWLAHAGAQDGGSSNPEWKSERYLRPPFDKSVVSGALHFSADGTMLAVWIQPWIQPDREAKFGPKLYLIPMSEAGAGDSRRALASLPDLPPGVVQFDWLPDNRHLVVALVEHKAGTHLSLVDLKSESVRRLTMGVERENFPAVSARQSREDRITKEQADFDIIEIPADGKRKLETLLGTSISESDPRWSPKANTFVYATDRNGKREIVRRSYDGSAKDERLVSEDSFSDGPTNFLGDPVQSPDEQRIAYTRARGRGHGWQIWVSTISGAAPQPLVEEVPGQPFGVFQDFPTWSPDNWIAFNQTLEAGSRQLVKAQVGNGKSYQVIYQNIGPYPCPWSPDGRQLACQTSEGLIVISSEGVKEGLVTDRLFLVYDWDKSGTSINGLRTGDDGLTVELVSIDVRTRRERILRSDVGRRPRVALPIRGFSQTSHGTFLTSIARLQSQIYVLEGLQLPGFFADWFRRFLGRRP